MATSTVPSLWSPGSARSFVREPNAESQRSTDQTRGGSALARRLEHGDGMHATIEETLDDLRARDAAVPNMESAPVAAERTIVSVPRCPESTKASRFALHADGWKRSARRGPGGGTLSRTTSASFEADEPLAGDSRARAPTVRRSASGRILPVRSGGCRSNRR